MPVLDGNFEAFVTNLGKYNEGELVGEWVKFPISAEEMQKVFERIGIGSKDEFGQPYEEWFITDYECPVSGVYDMLGEYENLDKLNYLAARIDEMDKWDQEKFTAIMEAGCDEVSDIDDLINLTYNLDCYDIIPDVHDESDLGYYYVHEAGIYEEKDLGPLANYIDYERFGRDIQISFAFLRLDAVLDVNDEGNSFSFCLHPLLAGIASCDALLEPFFGIILSDGLCTGKTFLPFGSEGNVLSRLDFVTGLLH